jgi:uncharacterized cupredoxin-like copper-binding protein
MWRAPDGGEPTSSVGDRRTRTTMARCAARVCWRNVKMSMSRRWFTGVPVAVAAVALLAACGSPDPVVHEEVTRIPDAANMPVIEATPEGEAGGGGAVASDGTATVTSYDIYFEPKEVTIPAATDIKFILPNAGAAPHNFAIDALNISQDQAPGETHEVTINAPAGEYEFYCNVPGHKEAGMVGKLIADPNMKVGEAPAADAAAPAADAAAPAADAAAPAAAAAAVTVVSHDIYFEPKEFSIPADTDVKVILPNEGAAPHNFAIDALNISQDQAPGETHEVTINAPAGEYEFYCNVPGHKEAGMVGKMTVSADAAPAADAAAPAADAAAPAADAAAPAADAAAPAADAAAPAAAAESVTVVSHDIYFDPKEFSIPADTDVTVILPNEGAAPHNFAIDALNISKDQAPGETHEVVINAPAGEYEFYCNVPGHKEAGMVGKMTAK